MKVNQFDLFPCYEPNRIRTFTVDELSLCKSLPDSYAKTMELSGLTRQTIKERTGIATQALAMMCSGKRGLPEQKREKFYRVCNNLFAHQWFEYNLQVNSEPTLDMFKQA